MALGVKDASGSLEMITTTLALKAIPIEFRAKYLEIMKSDRETALAEGESDPWGISDIVRLGCQLRWGSTRARILRTSSRTLVICGLFSLYSSFSQARDAVFASVLALVLARQDYRRTWQIWALRLAVVHFTVSSFAAWTIMVSQIHAPHGSAVYFLSVVGARALLWLSFSTGVAGFILWLIDFLTTRNVLTRGGLFRMALVVFVAMQALNQWANYANSLGMESVSEIALVQISKVQQVTTNLTLPTLAFIAAQQVLAIWFSALRNKWRGLGLKSNGEPKSRIPLNELDTIAYLNK